MSDMLINITAMSHSWDNGGTLIIDAEITTADHGASSLVDGNIVIDTANTTHSTNDLHKIISDFCQDYYETDKSVSVGYGRRLFFGMSVSEYVFAQTFSNA